MSDEKDEKVSTIHQSDGDCMAETPDGWWYPRCECGWESDPVPDREMLTDALMNHAAEAAESRLEMTLQRTRQAVREFRNFLDACYGREIIKENARWHQRAIEDALEVDVDHLV